MEKEKLKGYLALLGGMILFSTIEVAAKFVESDIPPLRTASFRFFVGGMVMLPAAIRRIRSRHEQFSLIDFGILSGLGLLGVTITLGIYHLALSLCQANIAAIVFSCNPVFVVFFASLFLNEGIGARKLTAVIFCLAGVAIFILGSNGSGGASMLGILLMLTAAVCFGFYTVLFKRFSPRHGAVVVTCFAGLIGSLFLLPVSWLLEGSPVFKCSPLDWVGLLYLAVVATGMAYVLYFSALTRLQASVASMAFFLKPFLASIFAWIVLGETVTASIMGGGVFVLVGMMLALTGDKDAEA